MHNKCRKHINIVAIMHYKYRMYLEVIHINHLKELRINAGLPTVKEAGKKLSCSDSMIFQCESGVKVPGRKLATKMCEVYKCTMSDIYPINSTNSAEVTK